MSADVSPARAMKDLAVIAVLGSDRAARGGETPMGVLVGAAVAGARLRAGRRCGAAVQRIDECPIETGVVASEKQVATLERMLALSDAAMIEEWCSLAKARGLRVPRDVVPRLLAWWAKQPSRAPEVFEATGACGIWLAGLNPEWRKPVVLLEIPERADEVWQTGSAAERVAILRTVRQRDPGRALEMVRATFSVDGAEERRKFVEVLATGVSAGDEPFLESVLDDRSKTVRREAARVLADAALAIEGTDARIDFLARRLLGRPLADAEAKIVRRSTADLVALYATRPEDARRLVAVGEAKPRSDDVQALAAWTMLANELMNLDEVLCK